MLDKIFDLFKDYEERPNKFTLFMGERIRTAREEAGFSQEKLAKLVYLRRATLSDIENGKAEANAGTFVLLAHNLNKPLAYFLPPYLYDEIKKEDLSPLENEIITNLRYHVASDHFRKLVIDIVKAIGEFDTEDFVIQQIPYIQAKLEVDKEREEKLSKRRNIK